MILLTNEEIWDIIGESITTYEEDLQTIAKAQLKKVVEWMKDVCWENGIWQGLSYADFKTLLKELE